MNLKMHLLMAKIHNGSKYTLTFKDAPQLTRGSIELLEKNAIAAIELLADNIRWRGILDFVVRWDKDNLFDDLWNPPAGSIYSPGPGFLAYGDPLFGGLAALTEALTGLDMNGPEFDAGMWADPKNVSITSYGTELYIGTDPNLLNHDIDIHDFSSVFLHEILHSLGFWSTKQSEYDGFEDYPTKFDSLTIKIDDQWFFNGEKTREIYGGPLPLALDERAHYSDSIVFNASLMGGHGHSEKWKISDLDLAVLFDLGLDVIKWSSKREPQPELKSKPYDGIIESVSGKGKLRGTSGPDAFVFNRFEVFKKKFADKIIGFDASEGDTIAVSTVAFPALEGVPGISFRSTNKKKKLKKYSKKGYDFVYFEKKGRLYFDGNGSDKKWGDSDEGGLVAILKGKPELSASDFTLLA